MNELFIGISGILTIFAIGYVTLNGYIGQTQIKLHEKLILSPVFFFYGVAIVGVLNLVFGGVILSNKRYFLFVIFCYLLVHAFFAYSNIKDDILQLKSKVRPEWSSFPQINLLALIALLLVSAFIAIKPMISGFHLGGDTQRHIMFVQQLLNGFSFSHFPPYQDVPATHYPFLVHASLAYFVQLLNIHLFDAYFILQLFQSLLLPCGMFFLVYKLVDSFWIALTALFFATFYGGHDCTWHPDCWWFNTALQRLIPGHITRMLSLCFVPIFFFLTMRVSKASNSGFYVIVTGLVLGITGLCHTYAFAFITLFSMISLLFTTDDKTTRKNYTYVLLIGVGIAAIGYIPTIVEIVMNYRLEFTGQFVEATLLYFPKPIGQIFLTWNRFINHYGVVGILAICSLFFLKKGKDSRCYRILVATVLIILIITYGKGFLSTFFYVSLPYHPSQHKFGKVIYLVFVILSCFFLSGYAELTKRLRSTKRAVLRALIIVPLIGFAMAGLSTTLSFARNPYFQKWNRAKINQKFRDQSSIVNRIREFATVEDVIAVPEEIGAYFIPLSGLDALYLWHPKIYMHSRKFANNVLYAPGQLRKKIENISDLRYVEIVRWILKKYHITYLIVSKEKKDKYVVFDFLRQCGTGTWKDGSEYLIFKVDKGLIEREFNENEKQKVALFFSSRDSYQLVLGYYPLIKEQYLRPGLLQSRGLKVSGLTWGDNALWLTDRKKKRIYKIDPENGRILSSLENPVLRPGGIAWDGEALWSVDGKKRTIYRLNPKSGQIMHSIANKAARIGGLAWGDNYLWTVDRKRRRIYKISPIDGKVISVVNCASKPDGVGWRDGSLWIATMGGSRIFQISQNDGQSIKCFGDPSSIFSKVAWSDGGFWAFDVRRSVLVKANAF